MKRRMVYPEVRAKRHTTITTRQRTTTNTTNTTAKATTSANTVNTNAMTTNTCTCNSAIATTTTTMATTKFYHFYYHYCNYYYYYYYYYCIASTTIEMAIIIRGVQYVHWMMHKCIMVKVGGKRNTCKVCKKNQVNLSKSEGGICQSRGEIIIF